MVNNWALLGGMHVHPGRHPVPEDQRVAVEETVTVGPPFFNRWMAPIGLLIFALMGLAPLFGWRKTSKNALKKAFIVPARRRCSAVGVLHIVFGEALGLPAMVPNERFYKGFVGMVLQKVGAVAPLITVMLAGFNIAVIVQEF